MTALKSTILYLALTLTANCSTPSHEGGSEPSSDITSTIDEEAQTGDGFQLGIASTPSYLPQLKGKRVAVVANQTSVLQGTHLVDTLLSLGVDVKHVFAPEHGFRGKADAGAHIEDDIDIRSGLPILSLHGSSKKPSPASLKEIDILLFDIQDVGVRCYTYISTLHYVMEACAEQGVEVIVLDRPNPNGHYVDGPVLKEGFESFVGMHPVPLVHGMTIGEYALMIKGEQWIAQADELQLSVVSCDGYSHDMPYALPVPPSPNLPNPESVASYPSLVLFEGTVVSIGRGTEEPFQVVGHPEFESGDYVFTPRPGPGSKYPKLEGQACRGYQMNGAEDQEVGLVLGPLLLFHRELTQQDIPFFLENLFFDKLAGNSLLREQIASGMDEIEIRESWEADLSAFEEVRANYLIYP